jgi:hypothetical protein
MAELLGGVSLTRTGLYVTDQTSSHLAASSTSSEELMYSVSAMESLPF